MLSTTGRKIGISSRKTKYATSILNRIKMNETLKTKETLLQNCTEWIEN